MPPLALVHSRGWSVALGRIKLLYLCVFFFRWGYWWVRQKVSCHALGTTLNLGMWKGVSNWPSLWPLPQFCLVHCTGFSSAELGDHSWQIAASLLSPEAALAGRAVGLSKTYFSGKNASQLKKWTCKSNFFSIYGKETIGSVCLIFIWMSLIVQTQPKILKGRLH